MPSRIFSLAGIAFMRLLGKLPLAWVRALGVLLGWVLYMAVAKRRKVVRVNLALCLSQRSAQQRRALEPEIFIKFAQAWLDRGWLWHAPAATVAQRLRITGAVHSLDGTTPTVLFAPHFVGMDAGGIALMLHTQRQFTSIYTDQSNKTVNTWMRQGRERFGNMRMFGRMDGVRDIANSLKAGQPLYLLPDMDFGEKDSLFVPFFGVPTATVPSLARFAKLGGAQVVTVVARITPQGYDVELSPPWTNFPSGNLLTDTTRMNHTLQDLVITTPEQYYWVHKRFKTRPAGEADFYA